MYYVGMYYRNENVLIRVTVAKIYEGFFLERIMVYAEKASCGEDVNTIGSMQIPTTAIRYTLHKIIIECSSPFPFIQHFQLSALNRNGMTDRKVIKARKEIIFHLLIDFSVFH